MYYAPYFTFGGKNPSQGYANASVTSNTWVENNSKQLDLLLRGQFSNYSPPWHGLITATTLIQPLRWRYTIQKILFTTTPEVQATNTETDPDITDYLIGEDYVSAYNIYEMKHALLSLLGDGSDPALIPEGFEVVPVAGVVTVYQVFQNEGEIMFVFERNNGIDGECV